MKHFKFIHILLVIIVLYNTKKLNRKSHCVDFSPDLIFDKPRDLPSFSSDKIKIIENKFQIKYLIDSFFYKFDKKDQNFFKFSFKEKCSSNFYLLCSLYFLIQRNFFIFSFALSY